MKYEFLEHTSDAKFKAYGKNFEECFMNAAEAMTKVMIDPEKVENKLTKSIQVSGTDLKQLLYNFLEELLFLFDTQNFILNNVSGLKINPKGTGYLLTASLNGDTVDENHQIQTGIKAITYMDMEVKENYCVVVVDI